MNAKLSVRPLAAMLLFAALAYPQSAAKTAENKSAEEKSAATAEQANQEAHRQASVALKDTQQSPPQTVEQAIAFERYKELAAEKEARKEGHAAEADRSLETPRPAKAKPAKKQ